MSITYYAAEALWREAWRLARDAEAVPTETAEREAADAAFSLALGEALAALKHPRATSLAHLTDNYVVAVRRVAEVQSATLATAEDSPERDQANAVTIAAYIDLGRVIGIERMLEERVSHHVGAHVPEGADERALYFQEAAIRTLYDVGPLAPRILLTLAGTVMALPEGRRPPLLQPRKLGRGEAGTTRLKDDLQQTVALRILMDSILAGWDSGVAWVEREQPGITGRNYQRWLARAGDAVEGSVKALADKLMQQSPLTAAERDLYERLSRRTLRQMIEGLAHLT